MNQNNQQLVLEMRFSPNTIEHLGVRMYSTLPPVIAELIANAYDADAHNVIVSLKDESGKEIEVLDDGFGMSFKDLQYKFLVIGRNRRSEIGEGQTQGGRKVIGKKGLGKLSFFGIAKKIEVETVKDGVKNSFLLDWDRIISQTGPSAVYNPEVLTTNETTSTNNYTKITLKDIQREAPFNAESLADSISRYFILDRDFNIKVKYNNHYSVEVTNDRKYNILQNIEVKWNYPTDIEFRNIFGDYDRKTEITGELLSTEKPIPPNTHMRGITLFSRKKLVNLPEYFSNSISSHFFNYLTGWLEVDFIDDLDTDVIGTNRQSLNWDHPEMKKMRDFLQNLLRYLEKDWREERKQKRLEKLSDEAGVNMSDWVSKVPEGIRDDVEKLAVEIAENAESQEDTNMRMKLLKKLIPEYTYFHYQNLHLNLQEEVFEQYKNRDYYNAVAQGVILYIRKLQRKSFSTKTDFELLKHAFYPEYPERFTKDGEFLVSKKYKRSDGSNFEKVTYNNIESGHRMLVIAVWKGFRNPIHHELSSQLRDSGLYTEQDCLDALGLLSHLFRRLDNAELV